MKQAGSGEVKGYWEIRWEADYSFDSEVQVSVL